MSTTIDKKVVEMRFDSDKFESGVETTLSLLDRLKKSLNLSGASKGFEDINSAAKKVDMSGLGSAVDTVRSRFSALEVMAVTALANITNSAVNAGKRIVSALTIDPIKTGFSEYETKINSIQTIMSNTASKGTTMEDVTRVIGELNTYADKTIYNFAEMTRNIGTFTAAGIGLEESATAIKGIANLAAASGSSSQQASTAMYQLSQALASGTVKLMDWNSVVNAGMGGQLFQDALKDTARAHGVAVDDIIAKEGSFRDSLQKGWITSEILTETLQKMTKSGAAEYLAELTGIEQSQITAAQELVATNKDGTASYDELAKQLAATGKITAEEAAGILKMADNAEDAATKVKTFTQLWDTLKEAAQSGWGQSWEIIVGDFEEAKELFTEISDVIGGMIGDSAAARNELLQGWKDAGGRAALIDSLRNAFEGVLSIIKPIKEAFREVFPPITVKQLVSFTEKLRDLTARFKLSEKTAANLKAAFKGLFSVIGIGIDFIKSIVSGVIKLASNLSGIKDGVLGVAGSFGSWITGVREAIHENNIFGKSVEAVTGFVQKAINKISEFGGPALNIFKNVLGALGNGLQKVGGKIYEIFSTLLPKLWDALKSGDLQSFANLFNTAIFSGILLGVRKFVKNFADSFGGIKESFNIFDSIKSVLENVTGVLDTVKSSLQAWQKDVQAGTILKIASAIAILAISIIALSSLSPEEITNSLGAVTMLFSEMIGAYALFAKIGRVGISGSTFIIGMSVAILILTSALKKLASLNFDELEVGIVGIGGLALILTGVVKILSTSSKTVMKGATAVIAFAFAIKILADACIDLSKLNWEEIGKGLVAVGGLMTEVVIFTQTAKTSGKMFSTAVGIVVLASALKILESSCKNFAAMNWEEIGKGLAGVGGLLTEVMIFSRVMGNASSVMKTAFSLGIIGTSLLIFIPALERLGNMSWEQIQNALMGLAGALGALALAAKLFPEKNLMIISMTMPVVSSALLVVAQALERVGKLTWEQIIKGLTGVGLAIVGFAVGLRFMNNSLKGASAMLVASAALIVFAGAIAAIAAVGITGVVLSIATIVAVFGALKIAVMALGGHVKTMLALSGSIATLGLSFVVFGAGLMAIGAGLLALLTNFVAILYTLQGLNWTDIAIGIAAIAGVFVAIWAGAKLLSGVSGTILKLSASVALLGISCIAIAGGIALIVASLTALAAVSEEGAQSIVNSLRVILVGFFEMIPDIIPSIVESVKVLVLEIIDSLSEMIPALADGFMKTIVGALEALVEYTPQILDLLMTFLIDVINGLAARIPELVTAAVNLVAQFFGSFVDAVSSLGSGAIEKLVIGLTAISGLVWILSSIAGMIPMAMVGLLGIGALVAELGLILAAIGALAQIPGLKWLIDESAGFLQSIGTAIGGFVGGIVGGFMSGVSSQFPKIGSDLSAFMVNITPFIEGAKKIDPSTMEGVAALAGVILALTAANVLDGLTSWFTGGTSLTDFGAELAEFGPHFKKYYESIKGVNGEVVEKSANAALALGTMAANLPREGGVAGWFMGENSLTKFAEGLVEFGPKLVEYANSVKGLDTQSIETSVGAATAVAEMASKMPDQGGVVGWFTGENSLSIFAEELAAFGPKLAEYAKSVKGLDKESVDTSVDAAVAIAEMASKMPDQGGVVSWFAGDNTLSMFAEELAAFGPKIKEYAKSVSGLDGDAVTNSVTAATAIAELARTLPDQGGVVSWFAGDNTLSAFGEGLITFGTNFAEYAEAVKDIDKDAVTASTAAAQSLLELQNGIPDSGGWFSGERTLGDFAKDLADFAPHFVKYADSMSGLDNGIVTKSANAAVAIARIVNNLPDYGGVSAWLKGDNSLAAFAEELAEFGPSLKEYVASVEGIDSSVVANSVNAANTISDFIRNLPDYGGVSSWFTGDNTLSTFAKELTEFGPSIKVYADSVSGLKSNIVTTTTFASKAMTALVNNLPDSGLVSGWFTGDNSLSVFAKELETFGPHLKGYSDSVAGVDSAVIENSVKATTALATLASQLPDQGGMSSWFAGDNTLSAFGSELAAFGPHFKSYADSVAGLDAGVVFNSANAARSMFELIANLPELGGVSAWFAGDATLSAFAQELAVFGPKLKAYADSVMGLDVAVVTNSTNAALSLAALANNLPDTGGLVSWFTGDNNLGAFGESLVSFGNSFAKYSAAISGVDANVLATTTSAAAALVELQNGLPESGGWFSGETSLADFGASLSSFGSYLSDYSNRISGIDTAQLTSVINETNKLADMVRGMSDITTDGVYAFTTALAQLGQTGVEAFINAFNNASSRVKQAGSDLVARFIEGVNSKQSDLSRAFEPLVEDVLDYVTAKSSMFESSGEEMMSGIIEGISNKTESAETVATNLANSLLNKFKDKYYEFVNTGSELIVRLISGIKDKSREATRTVSSLVSSLVSTARSYYGSFSQAGQYLVRGFADGILKATIYAEAEARAMAQAALKAAQEELDINSPSKVFRDEIGMSVPEGTAVGIKENTYLATDASSQMSKDVIDASEEAFDEEKFERDIGSIVGGAMSRGILRGADKAVRVSNKASQKVIKGTKEAFENSTDWIERHTAAGNLSLIDELSAWERVQARYKSGTEERKKADEEIIRLRADLKEATEEYYTGVVDIQKETNEKRLELDREYYDKTKEINEKLENDILDLNNKYNDAVESRSKTLYESYSLFDGVKADKYVTGAALVENLQDQLTSLEDWMNNINALAARGLDSSFIDELREMGVSAAAEIKALNALSDTELGKYVSLWEQKHALAKQQAIFELEGMQAETLSQIAKLRVESGVELEAYKSTWLESVQALADESKLKLDDLKTVWMEKVVGLKVDTESEFSKMIRQVVDILGNASGWSESGASIIEGVVTGVANNSSRLTTAIESVMSSALNTAKKTLGINSPSKEFATLGMYSDEGFALGLVKFSNRVENSAETVGNRAIRALGGTIARITDIIESDIDTQPTIRPVLDLSNVESGTAMLSNMLSRTQAMSISSNMNRSNTPEVQNGETTPTTGNVYTFTQNNYSPKALSRLDIYRQTKNQFAAMKGLVER